MCGETGISLDQYKRIMPLLVKLGLIVTERHLFKNKVTPFIRLTDAGRLLLQQVTANPLVSKPTNPLVSCSTNPVSTEITSETTTSSGGGTSSAKGSWYLIYGDNGSSTAPHTEKGGWGKYPSMQNVQNLIHSGAHEKTMKAGDILKNLKTPVTGNLGAFWQQRRALVQGGYQKPLTGKEMAQLKQLHTQLGELTRPVIDYVMNHWTAFASRAGVAAGCTYPADPHIGFLLKHHAVAVNLLQPEVVAPPLVESPVQLIAAGTEPAPIHHVSSQELTDLLDGLKSP
jgi:DNA-binding MarR family transcriptional regulator